jgi:hypothetical protein
MFEGFEHGPIVVEKEGSISARKAHPKRVVVERDLHVDLEIRRPNQGPDHVLGALYGIDVCLLVGFLRGLGDRAFPKLVEEDGDPGRI